MSIGKKFQRTQENFECGHCNHRNTGNGYTNHCTECLWSRHVDINPGDRNAECKGLMAPVGLETKKGEYVIIHECTEPSCCHTRKNKVSPNDSMHMIITLSSGRYNYLDDPRYIAREKKTPKIKIPRPHR